MKAKKCELWKCPNGKLHRFGPFNSIAECKRYIADVRWYEIRVI